MVKTRNNLDTSQIVPKKIQRPRKIPNPMNNANSAGVDLYNVDTSDNTSTVVDQSAKDSEAAIPNNIAAPNSQDPPLLLELNPEDNEFCEYLAVEVNNSTEHTETQLIDSAARALSKVNTFQDANAPPATTGTYPRQGSVEAPCRSDESDSSSQLLPKEHRPAKPQEHRSAKHNSSPAEADESIPALGTGETQS
jgi:hypothetical protein